MPNEKHLKFLDKYKDFIMWASQSDAEIVYGNFPIYSTKELKTLEYRLTSGFAQNLCVIGLSGQGKTTLCRSLDKKLPNSLSIIWRGTDNFLKQISQLSIDKTKKRIDIIAELVNKLIELYGYNAANELVHKELWKGATRTQFKNTNYETKSKIGLSDLKFAIEIIQKNEIEKHPYARKLPQSEEDLIFWLRDKISSAIMRLTGQMKIFQLLAKHKTILIDTEAYSGSHFGKLDRHISGLQNLWRGVGQIAEVSPNWVIFMQKELYDRYRHFFIKKFQEIEMERIQPKDFVKYVNLTFNDQPFSDEALFELAALSQGVWRRFKWYIYDCIIKADEENKEEISFEDVKRWIGINRVIEDLESELTSVFRQGGFRREAAAKVLIFLTEGEKLQSDIQQYIGTSAKECSIILNRLEQKNYINSKRRGLLKIWKINVEGGD